MLAVAKAKEALRPADKAELLKSAAVVVTPELGALPAADLIKVLGTEGKPNHARRQV